MAKLRAIFTNPHGWALVLCFVYFGLKAVQTHLTGSASSDVGTIVSILGLIMTPTDMTAGRSI